MVVRGLMTPQSVALTVPDTPKYKLWDAIPEDGVIAIFGAQGTGKTAFAMSIMEQVHERSKGERGGAVYMAPPAMRKLLPDWVEAPRQLRSIPRNAVVVIDAQGVVVEVPLSDKREVARVVVDAALRARRPDHDGARPVEREDR